MLGIGLGEATPYVIYGLSFVIAFLCVLYRNDLGIVFIGSLLPVYSAVDKALKLDLPFANNVIDMVIAAMLLGWLFHKSNSEEQPIGPSQLFVPIVVLLGYTFMSFLFGLSNFGELDSDVNIARLAIWKNYMIMPVLYLIVYYNVRSRKLKYAFFLLLFLSFLVGDLKFRQSFMWVKHSHYMDKSRVGGTLGILGPNEWGAFHAIYTLFVIGLLMIDRNKWRRIGYLIFILGGTYSLMYSYSRGGYIGFVAGLTFVALIRTRKLLVGLFAVFLLWETILPLSVVERIEATFLEESTGTESVSVGDMNIHTAGRRHLWEDALDEFTKSPLEGSGFATYRFLTGWDTHNVYFKTLAEQGLIGILIYLWLYRLALKSGWRLYKQADEELLKAFGFGFLCAVVGSIVVNFFGDRWTYLQLGGIYWILWALVDQENSRIALKRQAEGSRLEAMKAKVVEGSSVRERIQGF